MSILRRRHNVRVIPGVPGRLAQEAQYASVYSPVTGAVKWGNGRPVGAWFPSLDGGPDFYIPIVEPIENTMNYILSDVGSRDPNEGGSASSNTGNWTLMFWPITARYMMTDAGYIPGIYMWALYGSFTIYKKVSP